MQEKLSSLSKKHQDLINIHENLKRAYSDLERQKKFSGIFKINFVKRQLILLLFVYKFNIILNLYIDKKYHLASSEAAIPSFRISIELISNYGKDILKRDDNISRLIDFLNCLIPIDKLSKPGLETILYQSNRVDREKQFRAFFLFGLDHSNQVFFNFIFNLG